MAAHLRTSLLRAAALLPAVITGQLAPAVVTRLLAVRRGREAPAASSPQQSTSLLPQSVTMSCCAGAWAATAVSRAAAGALTALPWPTAQGLPHRLQLQAQRSRRRPRSRRHPPSRLR